MADPTLHAPELTEREAIAFYEKAVEADGSAKAHFDLGSAYFVAHELDNALREFQQALALQSNLDHAHYYVGVILKMRGEKDKARQELEKVLGSGANMMLKNQASIQLKDIKGK